MPIDGPTHVLTLLKGLGRGGAESLAVLAARHGDRERVVSRVGYLSSAHHDLVAELEAEGVPVTCLSPHRTLDPRWLWRLRQAMQGSDGHPPPHVVHAHSPVPAVGARLVARTLPRRVRPAIVTTEHNTWASHHRLTRFAESITFGLDDVHLAVSDAARRSLPPSKASQVEVMIQGVDLDAVAAAADRTGAREELGVADHEIVIGTVANLRPAKAYPDLLRAAREVIDALPAARFVSVGHGPLEQELHALHAEMGLGDRFVFLGHRRDAVRLMSGFDIFCLSSHHEGLPIALMEAMALGIPTVATRAGGIPELLTDGTEGHLVPPGQPTRLADKLISTASNPGERQRLGAAARTRGTTLSVRSSIARTEELYRQLSSARPR